MLILPSAHIMKQVSVDLGVRDGASVLLFQVIVRFCATHNIRIHT